MPCPSIPVKGTHFAHRTDTKRIQVDVSDQLQKIGVFFAHYRLVPILKKMATPMVPPIEGNGISGEQTPHEIRQFSLPRPQQEVDMVPHDGPCQTFGAGFIEKGGKPEQESGTVGIVEEQVCSFDSPYNDMLESIQYIDSRGSWHG